MSRTRRVLMVAFVATALCVDRVVAAAPALRSLDAVGMAQRMAGRLMGGLRRVAAERVREPRAVYFAHIRVLAPGIATHSPVHAPSPVHEYRLPPPQC